MASMCAPPRGFMRATARAIDLLLQYAVQNEKKMAVLLILKMAAATVTLHSGYRHYIDRTTAQIPTRSRRTETVDDLVRRANASALFPPHAHFACPSCTPSRDIVGAALWCRSVLHVRQWGEMKGDPTGGLGSPVLCCLRWPAGMWGHLFVFKSGRRWADRCGAARRCAC